MRSWGSHLGAGSRTVQVGPQVHPFAVSTPVQVQPPVGGVQVGSPPLPPVVMSNPDQVQPPLDGVRGGAGGDAVVVFPSLNTRASPKHLVSQIKQFSACQRKAVVQIGLGELLNLEVDDFPKKLGRSWVMLLGYSMHTPVTYDSYPNTY
ncbi:PREDICTED: uncharacterized protein LOC109147042 [Ipomoea nil]|uniref:uncharacterized protein LOC109147042 n=1 Tax=Ipomoea nil TaxID=35883 RepID=UPI000901A7FE|nr:PREDICTED: uncharacterized protein LOC109147042 [Ipomoea nil]